MLFFVDYYLKRATKECLLGGDRDSKANAGRYSSLLSRC